MGELDKFKELPHINSLYEIVDDWGYAPNLYHFDGDWHVSWIHCEEGDGLEDFVGKTPEEAINKAYEWVRNEFKIDKAKAYIKEYTRHHSNELMPSGYHEWITPYNALRACEKQNKKRSITFVNICTINYTQGPMVQNIMWHQKKRLHKLNLLTNCVNT